MIPRKRQWDPCVSHRGAEAAEFLSTLFSEGHRKALIIAGAGFDPRSARVTVALSSVMGDRLQAVLLREKRNAPPAALLERAEINQRELQAAVPNHTVETLDIFAADGAVIGGREAVATVRRLGISAALTDIVVDLSALSIGVSFPIVRYVRDFLRVKKRSTNLHIFVTDEPDTDASIVSMPSDKVEPVHGFKGEFGLDQKADAARLWLPQVVHGRRTTLQRIHSYVRPHDVCPILPFPASHPRRPDELIEEYAEEFESRWSVDAQNIVYADERNPLDLYRTILSIDDARQRVFEGIGGSMTVLSPLGAKVLSIGALMAALERDFPILYVEALSYSAGGELFTAADRGDLVHVWVEGEAYVVEEGKEVAG